MKAPSAGIDPLSLHQRLARLRRRLRLVILWRGVGCLLTAVLLIAIYACVMDWAWHLPSLVRAVFLIATLLGGTFIAYRALFRPLTAKADDLALALRVEERYPVLNDSLASTIEFLRQPADSEAMGSASMRREAVRRALRRADKFDFNQVIDRRGVRIAGVSMLFSCALAVALVLVNPGVALTALLRFANPFGGPDWPHKTLLELETPPRQIGCNQTLELHGVVRGVIPQEATLIVRFDGQPIRGRVPHAEPFRDFQGGDSRSEGGSRLSAEPDFREIQVPITRVDEHTGDLVIRLTPDQYKQHDFRFQLIRLNDAATEEYEVKALRPPQLVPLNGRSSPQVHLDYPAYTELPAVDLPDGSGNVEAIAGTAVTLHAAADHALSRAWIEYQPEPSYLRPASVLAPLGTAHPAETLALYAGGQTVWDRVPATLDGPDHRQVSVRFQPRVSGLYALHFEDEIGLHNSRLFELRVVPDPAPAVNLERPAANRDSLSLLPEAEFTLQAVADDTVYAVRSMGLEYRCKKGDPPRRLPLYDDAGAGEALAQLTSGLGVGTLHVPARALHLHLQHVVAGRRVPLSLFKHLDPANPDLKEGDVLTLQAVADDFDDVSVDKQPGRSHEIEIRIIGRNALEIAVNKEQAKIQQELVRLREQEREALKKVTDAEPNWKRQEKLTPEQVDQLQQAEQLQQQVRERIGPTQADGLRAQVSRLLETLHDNKMPRSATHERMEAVQAELDRLAREELEQIEPRLTEVRKENEAPGQKDANMLTEARKHQEEVEKTLNDLLSRLEPWTSTHEIKGEAKAILQEQRRLAQQTEELLQQKDSPQNRPEDLTDQQKAELEKLQQAQQKLEERTSQLLEKMERVAQEKKDKDAETAQELENARQAGMDKDITGDMREARDALAKNNLNRAGEKQKEGAKKLEDLVKDLEDRREAELDRLAKKLREDEAKLDELAKEQEELQKKVKEAAGIKDPQKREEELKRLQARQQKLQDKTKEMVDRLTRDRAGRASQALNKAKEQMEQAGNQLSKGQNAEEQQDDALDRLQEARDELKRSRDDTEEELAREQLSKIADLLKRLKERQEGLTTEGGRIQREILERKGWDRGHLLSLSDLARAQQGLSEETAKVAKEKLADAHVFARILRKAAEAMDQAEKQMLDRYERVKQAPEDTSADDDTARLQQEAARRLGQLIDALKPDAGVPQRQAHNGGGGGGGESGGGGGGGGAGDSIPPLAQLKLLRAMQEGVNQRTDEFSKQHPDVNRLNDKDKADLQAIRREQQEVADLLEELTHPAQEEGDKP